MSDPITDRIDAIYAVVNEAWKVDSEERYDGPVLNDGTNITIGDQVYALAQYGNEARVRATHADRMRRMARCGDLGCDR